MSPQIGCFGKLPIHADFIRHHAIGIGPLDEWLSDGIYLAKSRMGKEWEGRFTQTAPWNFAFNKGEQLWVGSMIPSHDMAGRCYPFLLFLEMNQKEIPIYHAPAVFAPFLEEATGIIEKKGEGETLKPFLNRVIGMEVKPPLSQQACQTQYELFLNRTTGEVWNLFFGDVDHIRKYRMGQALFWLRAVSPSVAVHLPLFPLDSLESSDIPFWFCLLRQVTKRTPSLLFWNRHPQEGDPWMLALFDPLPPKGFLFFLQEQKTLNQKITDQKDKGWDTLVPTVVREEREEQEEIEKIQRALPPELLEGLKNQDLTLGQWCNLW